MNDRTTVLYDELGFIETHGGVSRLFTNVMRYLPEDFAWKLTPVATRNAYLQEPPFNVPRAGEDVHDFITNTLHGRAFPGVSHVYKLLSALAPSRFHSVELANARSRHRLLAERNFDIYHETTPHPNFNSWKPVVGKKPIVATVVDLIPDLGGSKRVQHYRRQLLKDAAHIIAITETTKRDLLRLYDVPESKITVIYLGYDIKSTLHLHLPPTPIASPYVLFVGKRGGYKNFNWMVRALAPLLKDGLRLFCTGTPFSSVEKALFEELGVTSQISQSFVTDAEMTALFQNAAAFIHPSRYEGFGIPILDAFASGCPALLANASCFPEVGGDAALYFNLDDEDDFSAQLRTLLDASSPRRAELIVRGRERVKNFSWQKCACKTADVYDMVRNKIGSPYNCVGGHT